ncbi:MAG: PAS domain-containing protein [Parcubacteria group bacterium]
MSIVLTGNPIIGKEEELTRLDGTKAWALVTKFPWIDDDSGEIIGIIGIVRDITDRKER